MILADCAQLASLYQMQTKDELKPTTPQRLTCQSSGVPPLIKSEIATSMLDKGQQAPILVRADGARFVLVEGLHRLEAAKALGEKTIFCFLVDAPRH